MRIGMIGLGKMGANMTERLLKGGHEVVAFDLHAQARRRGGGQGGRAGVVAEGVGRPALRAAGGLGHGPGRRGDQQHHR